MSSLDVKSSATAEPRHENTLADKLRAIGGMSLQEYLAQAYRPSFCEHNQELPHSQLSSTLQGSQSQSQSQSTIASSSQTDLDRPTYDNHASTALHKIRQQTGCTLAFEIDEEGNYTQKRCVLTVTRPDGESRIYKSESVFMRKADAKAAAAHNAVANGALEFMENLECALAAEEPLPGLIAEPHIQAMEQRCTEAGCDIDWFPLRNMKTSTKHGMALRVRAHSSARVYSSDTTFNSAKEAKVACTRIAITDGLYQFLNSLARSTTSMSAPPKVKPLSLSLQTWFDGIPRPRPFTEDETMIKPAAEINATSRVNTLVQSAHGSGLSISYVCFSASDITPQSSHGCVLRLDHQDKSKTYLVDSLFEKKSDAKTAVSILAFSEDIVAYVSSIAGEMDRKVTEDMRNLANRRILPALMSECKKLRPLRTPRFEYPKEKDAYGALLTVQLSDSPSPAEIREFSVPIEYRNERDAKIAVACVATEEGVIEFLRHRGKPAPLSYVPYLALDAAKVLADRTYGKQPLLSGELDPSTASLAHKLKVEHAKKLVLRKDKRQLTEESSEHLPQAKRQKRGQSGPDTLTSSNSISIPSHSISKRPPMHMNSHHHPLRRPDKPHPLPVSSGITTASSINYRPATLNLPYPALPDNLYEAAHPRRDAYSAMTLDEPYTPFLPAMTPHQTAYNRPSAAPASQPPDLVTPPSQTILAGGSAESPPDPVSERPPSSPHVARLIHFLEKHGESQPRFFSEPDVDTKLFKTWIEVGDQRFEVNARHDSPAIGFEKLAKKILPRLQNSN